MHNKHSIFSGKLGFVLSAAGASVSLGNIWRFPNLAAKYGGGIFLLIYIVQQYTSCPIAATDHPLDNRGLHIRVMVEQNQRKWFVDAVSHNFGHIMIIAGIQKICRNGSP